MTMSAEIPISFTIVMVFVFLVVGFFIGRAVTLLGRRNKSKEPTPQPVVLPDQPAPLADPEKYTELIRLWREKKGSGLFVETSGHLLASSTPLNPAQKKRFIDLIKELAEWLMIDTGEFIPEKLKETSAKETKEEAPVPTTIKASTPVNTDPIPAALPAAPAAPPAAPVAPPPVPAAPNVQAQVQTQVPPAAPVLTPPVQSPPIAAADKPKKQATTMVEQVDEILQELIQNSDDPNRHIKLMEEKNEGVVVWVGQEHFIGIDTVTDPSAVELIRAAAKEWERRTEIRPNPS